MYKKIFFNLFLVFFLVFFQISFVSALPFNLSSLNLILIVFVFLLELKDLKTTLIWVLGSGFLIDIFYFHTAGVYLLSFFISFLFMSFLLRHFFTNRSLYSFLALIFFGQIIFKISYYSYRFLIDFIMRKNFNYIFNLEFFKNEFIVLGINILAVTIFFYFFIYFSSNFKPVFLFKRKN